MEQELLPLVQQKLKEHKELCASRGLFFQVVSTYRSSAEQDRLYAQGRTVAGNIVTNAKGGQSFHNHRVAYDICPLVNGKLDWSADGLFWAIGYYGKQVGLEWGGDFPNIKDLPHFQLTLGHSYSDFIAGKVDLSKFGVNSSPKSISALPEHVSKLLQSAKEFQVKEGITDFATETNLAKIKIGDRTLNALKKYQQ